MKCDNIKDLLMTDYLDNEVSEETRRVVQEHLHICDACAQFEQHLKLKIVEPFKRASIIEPPAHLWEKIKHEIEYTVSQSTGTNFLKEAVKLFRKPVFAASLALTAMLIVFTFFQMQNNNGSVQSSAEQYIDEQIGFMVDLQEGEVPVEIDFGTVIEEYFM